jgi:hypothetical protein
MTSGPPQPLTIHLPTVYAADRTSRSLSERLRRFEILLPLRFYDGTPVPDDLIAETSLEIEQEFGALSSEFNLLVALAPLPPCLLLTANQFAMGCIRSCRTGPSQPVAKASY